MSSYDHWKTTEPDYDCDHPMCEICGDPKDIAKGLYVVWICERCDPPEEDEE